MKITHLKPPALPNGSWNNLNGELPGKKNLSIFLAGSIEMGKAEMWQEDLFKAISEVETKTFDEIFVLNPRRDDWNSEWKQSIEDENFANQVEWELEGIEHADIVAFYLQPGTMSPISLMELGVVAQRSFALQKTVIVLCPEGFHRKGNVDVMVQYYDMWAAQDMDDFKRRIIKLIKSHDDANHNPPLYDVIKNSLP